MIHKADLDFFIEECNKYNIDNEIIFKATDLNGAIELLYKTAILRAFPEAELEIQTSRTPHYIIKLDGVASGEFQANCLASSISFFEPKVQELFDQSY